MTYAELLRQHDFLKNKNHEELWAVGFIDDKIVFDKNVSAEMNEHDAFCNDELLSDLIWLTSAKEIVLIHNHPNNSNINFHSAPSVEDVDFTIAYKKFCKENDCKLKAHLVVASPRNFEVLPKKYKEFRNTVAFNEIADRYNKSEKQLAEAMKRVFSMKLIDGES